MNEYNGVMVRGEGATYIARSWVDNEYSHRDSLASPAARNGLLILITYNIFKHRPFIRKPP